MVKPSNTSSPLPSMNSCVRESEDANAIAGCTNARAFYTFFAKAVAPEFGEVALPSNAIRTSPAFVGMEFDCHAPLENESAPMPGTSIVGLPNHMPSEP